MYFRLLQCLRLVKDGVVCTGWMGWFCWDSIFTPHVLFSVLFSWYLVSGMHYGWTVDWKNIVPWHRPYPLEIISFLKWKLDLHFHIIDKKISSGFSYGLLFVFKLMASFTVLGGEFLILLHICSSLLSVVITRFTYCLYLGVTFL